MSKSILLIGMSGVGKSTIGKATAKALKWPFIDGDTIIEAEEKKTLQEIINEKGLQTFMAIEEKILNRISMENTVIAPGGSIIYYESLMEKYQKNTTIFYLKNTLENIKNNIKNLETRGIAGLGNKSLEEIYKEREPLYEKYAHHVLNLEQIALSKAHIELIKRLDNNPT